MPISCARTSTGSSSAGWRGGGGPFSRGGGEPPALVLREADGGVDGEAVDALRGLGGHLLDVHAAGVGGHYKGEADGVVDDDAQVELAIHLELLLHQNAIDQAPLGPGLVGDELHADDLAGGLAGLVGRIGELDAAAPAAAAGVEVGRGGDGGAEVGGDGGGLVGGGGHAAVGDGDAVAGEDFFGLVFVDFHALPHYRSWRDGMMRSLGM